MKKVFALILALCMVFALCACGQTAAPAATEAPAADTAADAAPAEDTGWAPDGPVTMIVAYKAGNGTDVTARVLAQYAEKYIGQTVVIENVDGGSGSLGWSQLAAADPDGMTIGFMNLPNFNSSIVKGLGTYTLPTSRPSATTSPRLLWFSSALTTTVSPPLMTSSHTPRRTPLLLPLTAHRLPTTSAHRLSPTPLTSSTPIFPRATPLTSC